MGVVVIYKEPNFEGDQIPLRDGVHKRAGFEFENFEHIKSLRVEQYTVANIQSGSSRSTKKRTILRGPTEVADISTLGFDKIYTIEVYTLNEFLSGGYHPGCVKVYNQTHYDGRWKSLHRGFYDHNRLKSKEVRFTNGQIHSLCVDCGMAVFLYSSDNRSDQPNIFLLGPTNVIDVSNLGFEEGVRAIDVVPLRGYDNSVVPWSIDPPDNVKIADRIEALEENMTEREEIKNNFYTIENFSELPMWVYWGFIICFILLALLGCLLVLLYYRTRHCRNISARST